jgi:uncharacterized DUF497 family protein
MVDNRTRRRTRREMTRLVENLGRAEEGGNDFSNRQRRIIMEHRRLWNTLNPTPNSNSNSNRTRRVRSRSPSNSNRTRLAPSRRRSSAAPGRLIGSRTPSSPPGAPLRGRPRSRSSPSSSSRGSNSNPNRPMTLGEAIRFFRDEQRRRGWRAPSRSPSRSRSSPSSSSRSSSRGSNANSNSNSNRHWKVVKLNNPPKEDATLNNFNNKDAKAVKVSWTLNGKKFSDYYTPRTVTGLMYTFEGRPKPGEISNRNIQSAMQRLKSSSTDPNKVVFEHPKTRANVRKKNLEFVRLEKRTNENKAATKIQAAYRGGRERQKTLNRAKRTAALISKKRKRN